MKGARAIFGQLAGSWAFSRTIPHHGTMKGRAVFSMMPQGGNLHYKEAGTWTLENKTSQEFFKEYVYGCSESAITVYFNETPKRIYHILNLSSEDKCEADHQCNRDSYRGTYDFQKIDEGQFMVVYQVKGPKKDYTITTHFTKES